MTTSARGPERQVATRPIATRSAHSRARVIRTSANFGEAAEGFQLLERARPGLGSGRSDREEISDVEQNLEHQLIADVGAVEIRHSIRLGLGLGPVERFAVNRLEVAEDLIA